MNILKSLQKEIEKGNTLITKSGNIVSIDKVKAQIEKEYRKGIANGSIPVSVPYTQVEYDSMENFVQVETLINDLFELKILDKMETEEPEPAEATDQTEEPAEEPAETPATETEETDDSEK